MMYPEDMACEQDVPACQDHCDGCGERDCLFHEAALIPPTFLNLALHLRPWEQLPDDICQGEVKLEPVMMIRHVAQVG